MSKRKHPMSDPDVAREMAEREGGYTVGAVGGAARVKLSRRALESATNRIETVLAAEGALLAQCDDADPAVRGEAARQMPYMRAEKSLVIAEGICALLAAARALLAVMEPASYREMAEHSEGYGRRDTYHRGWQAAERRVRLVANWQEDE